MDISLWDSLEDTLKCGHLYKACFLLKGSSKWKFLFIISRWCLVCHRKWIKSNPNMTEIFRKFGCAMRFNSLRVEQGVDHLISPLDGAMPVNLKDMNLKQLKALTSILTDLSNVNTFQHKRIGIILRVEKIFSESTSKADSYAKTKKKYLVIFQ